MEGGFSSEPTQRVGTWPYLKIIGCKSFPVTHFPAYFAAASVTKLEGYVTLTTGVIV